ncbi:MAG TPA: DUF3306 domain-containing protein [Alphaproteobacteria bacterium]|nr:DUF3306 domain-containing protein [Alphaproteobacteria bacterium]
MSAFGKDGWLGRWSRRKTEAGKAARSSSGAKAMPEPSPLPASPRETRGEAADAAPAGPASAAGGSDKASGETEAGACHESGPEANDEVAKLPPVETLSYDSDFKPYLASGVPEGLRREALRKLWRSNPMLANLDGLNDYDEDYSQVGKLPEAVKTLFQVGRGMVAPPEESAGAVATRAAAPSAGARGAPEADSPESASEASRDAVASPRQLEQDGLDKTEKDVRKNDIGEKKTGIA